MCKQKKFKPYCKLTLVIITFNRDSTTQVNTLCERELSIFRLVAPVLRFDKPCLFVDKYQQYYPIVHFINSILTAMSDCWSNALITIQKWQKTRIMWTKSNTTMKLYLLEDLFHVFHIRDRLFGQIFNIDTSLSILSQMKISLTWIQQVSNLLIVYMRMEAMESV